MPHNAGRIFLVLISYKQKLTTLTSSISKLAKDKVHTRTAEPIRVLDAEYIPNVFLLSRLAVKDV